MSKLILFLCLFITVGCSELNIFSSIFGSNSDDKKKNNPTTEMETEADGLLGDGSVVGNGGDNSILEFSVTALKAIEFWEDELKTQHEIYNTCLQSEDVNEEFLESHCGDKPSPSLKFFKDLNNKLENAKIYTSSLEGNSSWETFKKDEKIYVDPKKWKEISTVEKIKQSTLAYISLIDNPLILLSDEIIAEIKEFAFDVDFSIDTYRNYLDSLEIEIVNDQSDKYSQEKLIEHMSLTMDCLKLASKRSTTPLQIGRISFIPHFESEWANEQKEISKINKSAVVHTYFSNEGFRPRKIVEDKRHLELGAETNLQNCFNTVMLSQSNNWILNKRVQNIDRQISRSSVLPPVSGDSPTVLEFINIAIKSLEYIFDKEITNQNYLSLSQIEKIKTSFRKTKIRATYKTLCTNEIPNCSNNDSVTAINIPEKRLIKINIEKWNTLPRHNKITLVIHEVLGVSQIEENNYNISSRYTPLIQTEVFQVQYYVEDVINFLVKKMIHIEDFLNYSNIVFQKQASTIIDCLTLVEKRFPGRLDIGSISLDGFRTLDLYSEEDHWARIYNTKFDIYGNHIISKYSGSFPESLGTSIIEEFSSGQGHLKKMGKKNLTINEGTTLQQCYNKVVAKGLANI